MGRDDGRQECCDALSEQDLPISGWSSKEGFQALLNLLADYAVRGDRSRKERRDNDKEERERVQQSWENRSRYSPVPISLELDRSEERRVGKECRSRRWPELRKKNK